MARPLRIEYSGAVYHVTSRGNAKKPIYKDDFDRRNFLDILHKVNKRYNWRCHSYCLMNNHYHLIIETPDGNLSKGMKQLNGVYTQWFNAVHNKVGHLFQGRYKAILIQRENHLLEACRYVVLNPVRAGAVENPGEWKWSSYNSVSGKNKLHPCMTIDWTLSQFSKRKKEALSKYREFVLAEIGGDRLYDKVTGQSILGDDGFIDEVSKYIGGQAETKEITKKQRYLNRPGLKEIFPEEILANKPERNKKILHAVEKYGYSQNQVASYLKMHYASISRIIKNMAD